MGWRRCFQLDVVKQMGEEPKPGKQDQANTNNQSSKTSTKVKHN
jgi:hypothetical protein